MNITKIVGAGKSLRAALPEVTRAFRWTNSLVKSIDRKYLWYTWGAAVIGGMTTIGAFAAFGFSTQYLVQSITVDGRPSMAALLVALGIMAAFIVLRNVGSLYTWYRTERFDRSLHDRLDMLRVNKIRSLDLGRLSDPEFQATLDFANDRGTASVSKIFRMQGEWISAISGAALGLSIIAVIDPLLLLLAAIPAVPRAIRSYVIDRRGRAAWERFRIHRQWERLIRNLITDRHRVTEAKLLRRESMLHSRYAGKVRGNARQEEASSRFSLRGNLAIMPIELGVSILALLYLGVGLVHGTLSISEVAMVMGSMQTAVRSFAELSTLLVRTRTVSQDFGYLDALLATQPLINESSAHPLVLHATPTITVDSVSFTYPNQVQPALRDCSMTIKPGERIALVGKNGSGKTTLARLIAKIYEPGKGEVRIDDMPTTSITQQSWLQYLLLVTQGLRPPTMRIDEAISGQSRGHIDTDRLAQALSLSAAGDFVSALNKGVESQIGEEWPGGVGFSTGQLQRLALAAAFYRLMDPDVRVAIFDEPMANVDVETRELFYSSLALFRDKTIIVIAHDPLYLHHFERVVTMESGWIRSDSADP